MNGTRDVIGLDVGSVAIKFVVLGAGGTVACAGLVPRSTHGGEVTVEEALRIRSILLRRGIECTRVAIGAPPTMATAAVLELPSRASGAPIDELARAEIARIMRTDTSAVETVCWEVPYGGRAAAGTTVMGVGCLTDRAAEIVATFEQAGLRVESIEPECVAIARAAGAWCGAGSCVTVDLGASSGRVCVVVGGHVAMERDLGELGVLDRVAHAASETGLSDGAMRRLAGAGAEIVASSPWRSAVETLASEIAEDGVRAIKESVAYVHGRASGASIERVCVCGWGGSIPGVAEGIGAELGVACSAISPGTAEDGGIGAVHGLAAGLALAFAGPIGRSRSKGGQGA